VTLRYVFTLIIYFKEIFMLGKRGVTKVMVLEMFIMLLPMTLVFSMIRSLTLAKLQGLMDILKNSLGGKPRCIVTSCG